MKRTYAQSDHQTISCPLCYHKDGNKAAYSILNWFPPQVLIFCDWKENPSLKSRAARLGLSLSCAAPVLRVQPGFYFFTGAVSPQPGSCAGFPWDPSWPNSRHCSVFFIPLGDCAKVGGWRSQHLFPFAPLWLPIMSVLAVHAGKRLSAVFLWTFILPPTW